ncbi:adenine deaminase [Acidaminobacter hydrogenoformans]|uniref:Adenine deaminase n=1 Tax=Acidaminobacter hydrogenoformans DSM 2784 TaxID=1120920 RepID=A0A1G5S7N6_9FIRM|nr:adenine deaminase [Acidaminobacter hydrogenoformans]SCZ81619.1 Adenine deaminase [Acidaminobacter hydrogenoformans DSM 2784]
MAKVQDFGGGLGRAERPAQKARIKSRIDVASGRVKADLVLKNARIVSVFTEEILEGDVAIVGGEIAGIGQYEGVEEIDLGGRYVAPGLIDGHVHIESSMVTPAQFAKTILPRGTTTIIADPHEIANVCGLGGIQYVLDNSEAAHLPLDVFVMLPSCVPSTSFENAGAKLLAADLETLIDHPRVLGLGEMMDYPAVESASPEVIDKLAIADGKLIDGHGPVIKDKGLNAYVAGGVRTEHECTTVEEMIDRLRLGMYIQIREGSAARNLAELVAGVNKDNVRRIFFCTDDRHPGDILVEGHIDNNVRLAISRGLPPITAIKMATLNAAEAYRLYDRGAVAPGYQADLIVFDDLKAFNVEMVFKAGRLMAERGKALFEVSEIVSDAVVNTVNFKPVSTEDLKIPMETDFARVIRLLPHSLVTESAVRKVVTEDGYFKYDERLDILKLLVIERHHATGNIGRGLVEGFGLKDGAIATTIAHDSHNLIVIGDSNENLMAAIDEIRRIGGGIAMVKGGEVVASMPLPIGGLMSDEPIELVDQKLKDLLEVGYSLGVKRVYDPVMTLAFLALPVIPEIKLTDVGLFDVNKFEFVPLSVKE